MMTERTVVKFLESAAANMDPSSFEKIASGLTDIPSLASFVQTAKTGIKTKMRNRIVRSLNAKSHEMDRITNACDATERAIEMHRHAQRNLEEKIEVSKRRQNSRQERVYALHNDINVAYEAREDLKRQLAEFDKQNPDIAAA